MIKKKVMGMILMALLVCTMLAGCGTGETGKAQESSDSGTDTGAAALEPGENGESGGEDKQMRVAFFWVSTGLDPAVDYDGWVLSRLGVGESLLRLNDSLEIEGAIADTWKNEDELTWSFHIRDGLLFSDGTAVDAQAVKASLERSIQLNDRAAEYLMVDEILAEGQDLTIKTTEPNAALANNIVEPVFNIIRTDMTDEAISACPVATGPYKIVAFSPEQSVTLVPNTCYREGEPGFDRIEVVQIADADARAMALQSGEIDLTNTIDHTSVKLFEDTDKYVVSSIISPRVNVAYMNNAASSPLGDKNLRLAVSYAVNREAYAALIGGSPAHSAYSDATPFGNETIQALSYDPEAAVALMDEKGYKDIDGDGFREMPDGGKLHLRFLQAADHGSADSAILATAVQSDLKAVGIDMEIMAVENLSDYQTQGNFDFYTANDNSAPTGDPLVWLETMYTGLGTSGKKNLTGFQNDRIDEIVETLKGTFKMEERYTLAAEASQILNDEAANLFLTNSYLNMVGSARLVNVRQSVCDYYFIQKDMTVR